MTIQAVSHVAVGVRDMEVALGFYRDVLVAGAGAQVALTSPDRAGDVHRAAREWAPESALRRLEAVLACREALDRNVKPLVALEAMLVALYRS